MQKKYKVACLGASIVKGNMSYNWVQELAANHPHIDFKNFGVNGNLAYNALQRIEDVIECQPDMVLVLVGTNDVNASLDPKKEKQYIWANKLPQKPDKQWYAANLQAIVNQLQQKTKASIAFISLPLLGENLEDIANKKIVEYNQEIKNICIKNNVLFIDFHGIMMEAYHNNPPQQPRSLPAGISWVVTAILQRYLLFRSWENIGKRRGFRFLTDGIHLNETGGKLLVQLIEKSVGEYWQRKH